MPVVQFVTLYSRGGKYTGEKAVNNFAFLPLVRTHSVSKCTSGRLAIGFPLEQPWSKLCLSIRLCCCCFDFFSLLFSLASLDTLNADWLPLGMCHAQYQSHHNVANIKALAKRSKHI